MQIGWGGTCKKHLNDFDSASACCKKQIPFGKKHPLGYDECRRHVKAWLLAGVDIDPRLPSARSDHLRINPRTDLYVPEDEAELDAQLASLNLDPE